jgi:hypothetical protein
MNERIKQLWDDAALASGDESKTWDGQVAFMALFAELIVREVFAKIEDERFEIYQPVKESVMKHFGVEE